MKTRNYMTLIALAMIAAMVLFAYACSSQKAEMVRPVKISDGEVDPSVWGKAYPTEYELWKKTEEPTPPGKSKYKKRIQYGQDHLRQARRVPLYGAPVQRLGVRDRVQ